MKNNRIQNPIRNIKKTFILSLFIFSFLFNLYADSIQCIWTGVEKIVAVGDVHGDYEDFVKILKGTGLIDKELHWTGGKIHLVQTGDIMDRGPDAKKVLDLLMRLEKEAEEAGGKVHALIGNHEEMNIMGLSFRYAGYVGVNQFISFLPDKYREKKEKEFRKKIKKNALKETEPDSASNNNLEANWKKFLREVIRNNNHPARGEYTDSFNEKYGRWILQHNAIIKINDTIFVHGGISEKFSTWKLEDINNKLREELNIYRIAYKRSQIPIIKPKILYVPDGPLWFRALAQKEEEAYKEEVVRILKNLDAKHMVIAHTRIGSKVVASEEEMSRFEGKIWIIDTGISEYYGGSLSALIIEKGKFSVWGKIDEE
ncbi:MAG: metallophosphoesterase [Candidatus Aminicenantes bacterium]|nr:metallophosphoesterase [Candidatus Aminicenantes bacterium]